jgi:hypothetical protein
LRLLLDEEEAEVRIQHVVPHAHLGWHGIAVDMVAHFARQIGVFEPVDACLGGHRSGAGAGWW